MSILSEVNNIKNKEFILGLIGFLCLLTPGFLTIFYLQREYLTSYDFFKLVLLSVSYISPFVTINTFLFLYVNEQLQTSNDKEAEWFVATMLSILLSGFIFYGSLAASYIQNLDFKHFVYSTLVFEAIMFSLLLIVGKSGNKKK